MVVLAVVSNIWAEGFRNPPAGAGALGHGGDDIVWGEGPGSVAQNPANLVNLTAAQMAVEPGFVFIRSSYRSPGGVTGTTEEPWKALPAMFAGIPIKDSRFTLGLGVTVPFGESVIWQPGGPFKYTAPYRTDLKVFNFNPTLAFRATDKISVGVGMDIAFSELKFIQLYPWFLFGAGNPDGVARFRGEGIGLGANAGVAWQLTDRQRVAATVRTPIAIDYSGDFTISNIPAGAPPGVTSYSRFVSRIVYPTIASVGYGVKVNDKVRVETDVEWIQFSNFKSLSVNIGNNTVLLPSKTINESWKNTFTAGISGDWQITPAWVLRAGYRFYQSPMRDYTYTPIIPDANQQVFTVGIGYQHNKHSVEASYGGIFYDDRNITSNQNPAYLGKYKFQVHLFACAYRYSF